MTREEARKKAAVMLAYAEGKEIDVFDENINDWDKIDSPRFNWGIDVYRIKPEPTYRPFKGKEECWAEMQKHQPFGWVMDKKTKEYQNLLILCGAGYELLFQHSVFVDGTPFGIEVKE